MNTSLELAETTPLSEIQRFPATVPRAGRVQMHHLIECGWLICLFAIVAAFCVMPSHSADEDLWWHLRTGAWILEHGAVPTQDFFAWSTIGKPWIAYTWLCDLLVAKTYTAGGLQGSLTLTTVL